MVKTDNHDPRAKLELRRYFLRKYHGAADPPQVLDCCQGSGVLWKTLGREFSLASYWGLDMKPKPGRLKLDSVRVLAQPGWPQNVVDIDTYGVPWKHWVALLPNVTKPTTVFLTIGQPNIGNMQNDPFINERLGFGDLRVPATIAGRLARQLGLPYCLAMAAEVGVPIAEAVEATSHGNARYVGVHLVPAAPRGTD